MKIEIWSDIACPFCYIGKRHFEAALEKFQYKNDVQVEWKSFQLDPTAKYVEGANIHDVLAQKKGWTPEYARQANKHVQQMAENAGLKFDFEAMKPANTLYAHKLLHLAAEKGLQNDAEELLFQAYFSQGKNVESIETLIEIGKNLGLNPDEITKALADDEYAYSVKKDIQEAQYLGIQGVPFFVFDRKYGVSGAQPVEAFTATFEQAWQEWRKNNPPFEIKNTEGQVCTPDGECG